MLHGSETPKNTEDNRNRKNALPDPWAARLLTFVNTFWEKPMGVGYDGSTSFATGRSPFAFRATPQIFALQAF